MTESHRPHQPATSAEAGAALAATYEGQRRFAEAVIVSSGEHDHDDALRWPMSPAANDRRLVVRGEFTTSSRRGYVPRSAALADSFSLGFGRAQDVTGGGGAQAVFTSRAHGRPCRTAPRRSGRELAGQPTRWWERRRDYGATLFFGGARRRRAFQKRNVFRRHARETGGGVEFSPSQCGVAAVSGGCGRHGLRVTSRRCAALS